VSSNIKSGSTGYFLGIYDNESLNVTKSGTSTDDGVSYLISATANADIRTHNIPVTASVTGINGTDTASNIGNISARVVETYGTLFSSHSSCAIASGMSYCSNPSSDVTSLTWKVNNPILPGGTAVTRTNPTGIVPHTTESPAGTTIAIVNYGTNIFTLKNNDLSLDTVTVTGFCVSGTTWDSANNKCVPTSVATIEAYDTKDGDTSVDYGGTALIAWSSGNATSCIAVGPDGWAKTQATSGTFTTNSLTTTGTHTYSIYCTGTGGISSTVSASVSVGGAPTGTITCSPTSATISGGSSTGTTSVAWKVTNPITSASTAVTRTNPNGTVSGTSATSGTVSATVNYGANNFYLYHNGSEFASCSTTATCASGYAWDSTSSVCEATNAPTVTLTASTNPIIPGNSTTLTWSSSNATSCSAFWTTSTATSGTAVVSPTSDTTYLITCTGSYGSGSASKTINVSSGNISVSSNTCTIPSGDSTCDVTVSWSTSNLTSASTAVTKNNPSGTNVSSSTSGNQNMAVNYGSTSFYLYHGGALLDSDTTDSSGGTVASCASGSTWSGSVCVPDVYEDSSSGDSTMTGSLTVPSCSISAGNESCNVTISWNTSNLVSTSTSAITSDYPSANTEVATGNSGTKSIAIPYGSRYFYLYNNEIELASDSGSATCVSGTYWDGDVCKTVTYSPTASITATPNSIVSGESSTLSWSSSHADSCVGTNFSTGGATSGTVAVSPTATTTYSVVCTGNNEQASGQATVTVTVSGGKSPAYKED